MVLRTILKTLARYCAQSINKITGFVAPVVSKEKNECRVEVRSYRNKHINIHMEELLNVFVIALCG